MNTECEWGWPTNKTIVHFRKVVNDAICGPWEPMPEIQPPTLQSLADYLKTCPGWDYRFLSKEHAGWGQHQVSHGPRALFWMPEIPKDEEFHWLNKVEKKL